MKKRRKQSGRLLAQLHGSFTPAHADGCAAQCFEGVQRGSIIIKPKVVAHAVPHTFPGSVLAPLPLFGKILAQYSPSARFGFSYPSALCSFQGSKQAVHQPEKACFADEAFLTDILKCRPTA